MIQSLWFGCVPVVVADHYLLPLSGMVDWSKAAVTVREENLLSTLSLLRAITMTQWSALQNHGRKVTLFCHIAQMYFMHTHMRSLYILTYFCVSLYIPCIIYIFSVYPYIFFVY